MKFFKLKGTEVRRIKDNKNNVVGIIGQVKELLSMDIISLNHSPRLIERDDSIEDYTLNNWLLIDREGTITEFLTLEDAKEEAKKMFLC